VGLDVGPEFLALPVGVGLCARYIGFGTADVDEDGRRIEIVNAGHFCPLEKTGCLWP
jgi:hypothetical protein